MVTFVCAASGPLEDKYQKILMFFKNKNLKLKNILNKFEIKKDRNWRGSSGRRLAPMADPHKTIKTAAALLKLQSQSQQQKDDGDDDHDDGAAPHPPTNAAIVSVGDSTSSVPTPLSRSVFLFFVFPCCASERGGTCLSMCVSVSIMHRSAPPMLLLLANDEKFIVLS